MSNRNNISPFPFFLDKGEQIKWYAFGRDYSTKGEGRQGAGEKCLPPWGKVSAGLPADG